MLIKRAINFVINETSYLVEYLSNLFIGFLKLIVFPSFASLIFILNPDVKNKAFIFQKTPENQLHFRYSISGKILVKHS